MKSFNFLVIASALAGVSLVTNAQTVVVPVASVFGHNEASNFGGVIEDTINGSGMNGYNWETGDANDYVDAPATWPAGAGLPSTWTATSGNRATYSAMAKRVMIPQLIVRLAGLYLTSDPCKHSTNFTSGMFVRTLVA